MGGMPAGDGGSISLPVLLEAEESAAGGTHESPVLSAVPVENIKEIAADLGLLLGLLVHEPWLSHSIIWGRGRLSSHCQSMTQARTLSLLQQRKHSSCKSWS